MNKHVLPTYTTINGIKCEFNSDFRDILKLFQVFSDPDLMEMERIIVGLKLFYKTNDYMSDIEKGIKEMFDFINMGEIEETNVNGQKPLYDWEKDFNIIVAPINKILGYDCRGTEYLHWWTFLSAFMDIGECTFSTYVSIRDKLNRGIKLEKYEEKILNNNRDKIVLKKKVDSTTQSIMNEILGV